MSRSKPLSKSLEKEMIEILQKAARPISAKDLATSLSRRVEPDQLLPIVEQQVGRGRVHRWPGPKGEQRFWGDDPPGAVQACLMKFLAGVPLTRSELKKRLNKHLFRFADKETESLLQQQLERLLSEGKIFEHPPSGRGRISRFGLRPAELPPYFEKLKKDYITICEKLNRADITSESVYQSLCSVLADVTAKLDPTATIPEREDPSTDIVERMVETIHEIEPAAAQQALVSIPMLRKVMGIADNMFDETILTLARQEKIWLHRHVDPSQLNSAERLQLVSDDRGNYFMGLVLREA